jgi:hypothetical protein
MKKEAIKSIVESGVYFLKVLIDGLIPDDEEDENDDEE